MLPGVGAFGAAMARLVEHGLDQALRRADRRGPADHRICVGHQLLFETSDESPGVRGLGRGPGACRPLPSRRPRAAVRLERGPPADDARLLEAGYAYFANSYRATEAPGWTVAQADHGGPLVAAMERGNVIGCQFHPELSGAYGEALLARFLELRLMLTSRIIPCLDVSHGRVVKGVRFQGLRDAGDPAERARLYQDTGGDEIVILDVSATPEGRGHQHETVRRVREVLSIPLTVGGGVREVEDAWHLLEAGADKVSVNTAAVERPELLSEIAERFGRQCCVVAIDAAGATAASRCWSRAGARAPASTRSNGRARPSGAVRARSCSPPGTATAPAPATIWS